MRGSRKFFRGGGGSRNNIVKFVFRLEGWGGGGGLMPIFGNSQCVFHKFEFSISAGGGESGPTQPPLLDPRMHLNALINFNRLCTFF